MTTLYNDGIRKVLKGITTIEEVFRVAKKVETAEPLARQQSAPRFEQGLASMSSIRHN